MHRLSLRDKSQHCLPAAIAPLAVALTCLVAMSLVACGAETVSEVDEAAIHETLAEYLPRLSEAYATGNVEVLRDFAAEKELAIVYKRIDDLMNEEGRVVEPTLESFEIEDINQWNYSNAFVTTLEVWDLKVMVSGSDQVTSQRQGQRNRVKYQLKRRGDKWQILWRSVQATFE